MEILKINVYLSRSTYAKAGILPIRVAGIFYACCLHTRFRTPVRSINVPSAFAVSNNGTGGTVFFRFIKTLYYVQTAN